MKKYLIPFAIVVLVLCADQGLKYWVHTHLYDTHKIIFPNWFMLYYTENNGMAFGIELGGTIGKVSLTLFRIAAVFVIIYYMLRQIRHDANRWFVICIALILAGAMGNIIDSVFYGVVFRSQSLPWFQGRVIDMLYFPIYDGYLPSWVPVWHDEHVQFFRPVFNIADASISVGIVSILLFQRVFFKHVPAVENAENTSVADNTSAETLENPELELTSEQDADTHSEEQTDTTSTDNDQA